MIDSSNLTSEDIEAVYYKPLLELIAEASLVHKKNHKIGEVQISNLLSVKTGGCPEDCAYCPQAARYSTEVDVHPLMPLNEVVEKAKQAKENNASRFCMGAAWREIRNNQDFEKVLTMVSAVNALGLEVCCTMGMLTEPQAKRLAKAGLYAYNHNIDTSEDYYENIISTRTFSDRIKTLEAVRNAGITVCCGGIIGLGENTKDRIKFLHRLATLEKVPESIPINMLVPVKGTPLENHKLVSFDELVRVIATARIFMTSSDIRLSAGRMSLSISEQALCFLAGANSIFLGEKLLTTKNTPPDQDKAMFKILGLQPRKAFQSKTTHLNVVETN